MSVGNGDSASSHKSSGGHGGLRSGPTLLLILTTELINWLIILVAIYLGVWQYCDITTPSNATDTQHYTKCTLGEADTIPEFWGVLTAIVVSISLLLYLPWRVIAVKFRFKYYIFRDERWRPSILVYILLGVVPSFCLILAGLKTTSEHLEQMDAVTVTAFQMIIMGLAVTEWTAKVQQEQFTFELLTAMALDFFFAYEVIAFIMISAKIEVFTSGWLYPCIIFAVVAMFKYLPTEPINMPKPGVSWAHVIQIFVNLLCNDIPFVIIRMSTMIIFHYFLISDMIFLFKNWFLIIFSCIQLGIIFYNRNKSAAEAVPYNRKFRGPEVWCDDKDGVCHVKVAAMNDACSESSIHSIGEIT